MLVQGPGGNTSLKEDGILFVKASGLWLASALKREVHVALHLAGVREALTTDPAGSLAAYCVHGLTPGGLRPSIETSLHALLPHRVVVHVHCVRTIALAVLVDGRDRFARCLAGLAWAWVPYTRPGPDLAAAVLGILRTHEPDILVLQNHGLVVGGTSVQEVEDRLNLVRGNLAAEVREAPRITGARDLAPVGRFVLPPFPETHSLGRDAHALTVARGGSLYPDHVVFLGRGTAVTDDPAAAALSEPIPSIIVVAERGVLVRADLSPAAHEMVRALALVAGHVPAGAVRYLIAAEEDEFLDWEAETYRQNLAFER